MTENDIKYINKHTHGKNIQAAWTFKLHVLTMCDIDVFGVISATWFHMFVCIAFSHVRFPSFALCRVIQGV